MKKFMLVLFVALAMPISALAEEWKNVSMVDVMCSSRVKENPDAHTTACAIRCADGGYGIIAADGTYLKFDKTGNEKALAALKASKKKDHVRATITGERDGETIKVESLTLE